MTLKSLSSAVLLAFTLLGTPAASAHANECVDAAIAQCDKRFPPDKPWLIVARGYCYLFSVLGCPDAQQT
jgi:hypothetical protein